MRTDVGASQNAVVLNSQALGVEALVIPSSRCPALGCFLHRVRADRGRAGGGTPGAQSALVLPLAYIRAAQISPPTPEITIVYDGARLLIFSPGPEVIQFASL